MSNFTENLKKYADTIIQVGLNLKPGQRLIILARGEVEDTAPLVRQVTRSAYEFGIQLVDVIWLDSELDLIRLQSAPEGSFGESSDWRYAAAMEYGERHDGYLGIIATDPFLTDGQDPEKLKQIRQVEAQKSQPISSLVSTMALNWCGVAAAGSKWAERVYPEHTPAAAQARLWESIFAFTRSDLVDPVAAWQTHLKALAQRKQTLSAKQFHALKFTGPGTNLTVGLAQDHVWLGGSSTTQRGAEIVPNLPTEEVFTTPDFRRVEGTVSATMPLNVSGMVVEGMRFEFKAGRVVDFRADKNGAALESLLEMDDGARRLGEVALVPHSSPISQSKTLFYNTLYDENAASHIALGRAYAIGVQNGAEMSSEAKNEAGVNHSLIHIDFMIGSGEVDVTGIHADGREEAVMTGGEWALTVRD